MITVISGTNRKNSKTRVIAYAYYEFFKKATDEPVHFLALEDLPLDILNENMYAADGQSEALGKMQDEMIIPANKLFIVSPEYNGGVSGILKLFIDAISIREYAATFKGKKAGLAGVASGRAGNLRGMDQLTGILNHVGMTIMPNKLPISALGTITDDSSITDAAALESIEKHVADFVSF